MLSIIDHNQDSYPIVFLAIQCLKVILVGGKADGKSQDALKGILAKPQLKQLSSLMASIKAQKGLKTEQDLLAELDKDVFSVEIQAPSHFTIPDTFLIKLNKYLTTIRAKYDKDRAALANKSYFTQDLDTNITIDDEPLDSSDQDSMSSDNSDLFDPQEKDLERRKELALKNHQRMIEQVVKNA